jgi:hypothetical protein
MGLLKPAINKMAYLKCGIFGFQGSGKTFTATNIGIGVCKATGNLSMAYFATEPGHNFLLSRIRAEGINVFDVKSRAFDDLIATINECVQEKINVLVIDSITHVWQELKDSYEAKTKRKRLEFQDWGKIKGKGGWLDYADLFNNSCVHIIACGRAGYEYDTLVNEDGSKDLVKTGTKMRAEAEFGFEPSLVIEMERMTKADISVEETNKIKNIQDRKRVRQSFAATPGTEFVHRVHVLKDRADIINGHHFDFTGRVTWQQIFEVVKPHFDSLNIGGEHEGIDTQRNSEDRFEGRSGDTSYQDDRRRITIALEELKGELDKRFPTTNNAKEKQARLNVLSKVYGTFSATKLEQMTYQQLEEGLKRIKDIFTVPENTTENMAEGKIEEPPPPEEGIPEFLQAQEG